MEACTNNTNTEMTIREYALDKGISYEAVRRQVSMYSETLAAHIRRNGRTQYLDMFAIDFLNKHRDKKIESGHSMQVEQLRAQLDEMRTKYEALLEEHNKLSAKYIAATEKYADTIYSLLSESKK